jgi:menaquinol-cytochrome c reductase iron-sulfur subunit
MSHSEHPPEDDVRRFVTPVGSRRKFFRWVTGAIAATIGAGLAVPLVGYVISPALKRRDKPWVEVGRVEDLPVGEPRQLDYVMTQKDGWMEAKVHKAVWAVKQADGGITVFSPLCTHLGCGYRWDGPDRKFKCPCHLSVYDVTGKVLGGPAPRHLDLLPAKVENGRLLVMYKEFKAGLPNSVEL